MSFFLSCIQGNTEPSLCVWRDPAGKKKYTSNLPNVIDIAVNVHIQLLSCFVCRMELQGLLTPSTQVS